MPEIIGMNFLFCIAHLQLLVLYNLPWWNNSNSSRNLCTVTSLHRLETKLSDQPGAGRIAPTVHTQRDTHRHTQSYLRNVKSQSLLLPEAAAAPPLPLQPRGLLRSYCLFHLQASFTQQSGIYLIFAHLQRRSSLAFTPRSILERRNGRLGQGGAAPTPGSQPSREMEIKVWATAGWITAPAVRVVIQPHGQREQMNSDLVEADLASCAHSLNFIALV